MTFTSRLVFTIACGAIVLGACGRDEAEAPVDGDASAMHAVLPDAEWPPELSIQANERRVGPALQGGVLPLGPAEGPALLPAPEAPPPPPVLAPNPEILVLEWKLDLSVMADLIGHSLVYQDPDTSQVYRGGFEHYGLHVTQVLDEKDGFIDLPVQQHFVIAERWSVYPMSFWDEDRAALVEVQDCGIELEQGIFHCRADGHTTAAIYDMQRVTDLTRFSKPLWCITGCPIPQGDPADPFFEHFDSFTSPHDQVLEYVLSAEKGVLLYEDHPLLPLPGYSMVTGVLLDRTEENLQALACDLDGDEIVDDTCLWRPVDSFYTYSVDADHVLPHRGPAIPGGFQP